MCSDHATAVMETPAGFRADVHTRIRQMQSGEIPGDVA